MATSARRAFRSGAEPRRIGGAIDWPEWRADEFMDAFFAPRRQLARSLVRQAGAHAIPLHWEDADIPIPFVTEASADCSGLDAIAAALAEEFGVSVAFVAVRLKKHRMVR